MRAQAHESDQPDREMPDDSTDRTLWSDTANVRSQAAGIARLARELLGEAVAAEPYLSTAAAFGLGILLGGGLPRGAAGLVAGTAARLFVTRFGDEILRSGLGGDSGREER